MGNIILDDYYINNLRYNIEYEIKKIKRIDFASLGDYEKSRIQLDLRSLEGMFKALEYLNLLSIPIFNDLYMESINLGIKFLHFLYKEYIERGD